MAFLKTIAPEQQCANIYQTNKKVPKAKLNKIHTGTVFIPHVIYIYERKKKNTFKIHVAQYISLNIN